MIIEAPLPAFADWWAGAATWWLIVVGLLGAAVLVLGLIGAIVRQGPVAGPRSFVRFVGSALGDLVRMSPRRVGAIMRLAVLESVRRMVLAVFVVFIVILLFAGWYLDPGTNEPAKLYLSFLLSTTSYLVLLLALLLSVFSLPNDIRNRTIYTVVTKPVRPSELVLGRILGFSLIGTAMLAATGIASYVFVVRGLDHTHEVVVDSLVAGDSGNLTGRTSLDNGHRHEVRIGADGNGRADVAQDHWHSITAQQRGTETIYEVGPPQGMLEARVPIVGTLLFTDRQGRVGETAQDVGKESKYRSWIEGGTQGSAMYTFAGVTPEQFPDGLPVELNLGVFRTHKGDVSKGILGSIILRNPDNPEIAAAPLNFVAEEYRSDLKRFARELTTSDGDKLDLFADLAPDGRIEVKIVCLEPGQYYGMAPTDVYLRARDASFAGNMFKAYVGIWLQMVVITAIGVTLSTFLNAAVAMLGTFALILAGFARGFIDDVANNQVLGGGPLESLIRLVTQANVSTPLEPGLSTTIAQTFDDLYQGLLRAVVELIPDLGVLSQVGRLANGFNIPADGVAVHMVMTLGYVAPIFVAGYVLLKMREVAG